jgi:hypothetical protein
MAFGDFGFWAGVIGFLTALLKLWDGIAENKKNPIS